MELSFAQTENILKILPISYYIKRKLDVELSETENSSYCDVMNDKIVISFKMLQQTAAKLTSIENLEDDIRCLLYHETSHAFLTPKQLTNTTIVNIFEDERIESLLRNYYKRVNFREFVKRVNNFKNEAPTTVDKFFYQIVRYRIGPQFLVDMVSKLIIKYKDLNRNETDYWTVIDYSNDIKDFYEICKNYFLKSPENKAYQQRMYDKQDNPDGHSKIDDIMPDLHSNKLTDEQIEDALNKLNQIEQTNEQIENEQLGNFDETANKLESIMTTYYSKDIFDDINMILSSVKNSTKQNSSAINAYSGVFNPRSVVRTDYKYFVQQNRIGHVKAFSKIHLNLIIDCSGSFRHNDKIVNQLLYALTKFEKTNSNFSFDLISCGEKNTLRTKNDRIQQSKGGNKLTDDIFDLIKKVQLPTQHNINIALFDGDAFSDFWNNNAKKAAWKNWTAFNLPNTTIISDYDNYESITKYCKNIKTIFTRNYVDELYKNVIMTLQTFCK